MAEWKLLSEGPAADHVAESLLDASSDAEREAMLAAESDIAGLPVLSALARIAGAAAVRQDYARTQTVYETFVFVARRGGFKKEEGEGLQNIANALYFQRKYPESLPPTSSGSPSSASGRTRPAWRRRWRGSGRSVLLRRIHRGPGALSGSARASRENRRRRGNRVRVAEHRQHRLFAGDFPAAIAAYRRALD